MAAVSNLAIDQGTTFTVTITVTDDTGSARNLTNYFARSQMRKSYYTTANTAFTANLLNPTSGIFYDFLGKLGVNLKSRAIMKCICRAKPDVARIDTEMLQELWSSGLEGLYAAMGGGNDSYSNRGRKSVYSLNNNKHKYKYNKLVRNNCTHRNKNKRKKNSKSNSKSKSKSKSKSSSKSPSYANKKHKPNSRKTKSSKSRRKNVTFKRRKRSNRH